MALRCSILVIEFCELHGSEYMEMLMHVSVRWLSLEKCLTRILQQYKPLASYLKSLSRYHIFNDPNAWLLEQTEK